MAAYDYADEDYIDMDINSSPKCKDFEFQMSFICTEKETTADELFYQGKLLPLRLLPSTTTATAATGGEGFEEDHNYHSVPCTHTTNTPLDSCNISPSNSCRVSCELSSDDFFFEWSTELSSFINNHPTKKPLSEKLKLIKHSVQKLKATRAYLKSLFRISFCNPEAYQNRTKHSLRSSNPEMESMVNEDNVQRRSFSGAINRHSQTKCCSSSSSSGASSSSSSFSFNSCGFNEVSIDAAIAHCKNSQQIVCSRNLARSPERRTKEEEDDIH